MTTFYSGEKVAVAPNNEGPGGLNSVNMKLKILWAKTPPTPVDIRLGLIRLLQRNDEFGS